MALLTRTFTRQLWYMVSTEIEGSTPNIASASENSQQIEYQPHRHNHTCDLCHTLLGATKVTMGDVS